MSYRFDDDKHIHLLDEQPLYGTSTVIKEVMPPFLAKWGAQCAVDFLKENPEQWDKAVTAWSKARDKAATKGTDMHAELEAYVRRCIDDHAGKPQFVNEDSENHGAKIRSFAAWSVTNVDTFLYSEVNTFSKELWCGGVVDCVAKLKTGELAVIDFKSSKECYFNHFAQVAGYSCQLRESGAYTASGVQVCDPLDIQALIVVPFGAATLSPRKITNVPEFEDSFRHIVAVYSLQSAFNKSK